VLIPKHNREPWPELSTGCAPVIDVHATPPPGVVLASQKVREHRSLADGNCGAAEERLATADPEQSERSVRPKELRTGVTRNQNRKV